MALDTANATTKLRGLTAKFDNAARSYSPFWPVVATPTKSTGSNEQYTMLGRVPSVREWEGERDFKQMRAADWVLTNVLYEESVLIDDTDLEDDRLGQYGIVMPQLGVRMAEHPDLLLFNLINNAETGLCYDTKAFFATTHTWGTSGAQSNLLAASGATVTAPTAAEFKVAFNAAVNALFSFKDDRGQFANGLIIQGLQNLVVLCPLAFRQAAYDALTAMLIATGGTNVVLEQPKIYASPAYTQTDAFDVYMNNMPLKSYIFQQRRAIRRQMKYVGASDIEFKGAKFMTDSRYVAGYGQWSSAVRTRFA